MRATATRWIGASAAALVLSAAPILAQAAAPPVTLHVDASAQPAAAQQSPQAPPERAMSTPTSQDDRDGARAFLRLRVDKHKLYAGESVPFTVRAYVKAGTGATLTGAPALTSDAFVVSGLDEKPQQGETTIGGEPYLAVTWHGVLSAAKPGQHPLELSLPLTLQYREPGVRAPNRGASLRDLLGASSAFGSFMQDPFFASMLDRSMLDQSMFDGFLEPGRMVSQDVTLRDGAGKLQVLALPEAGRPDDFSGAVGKFELEASLSRTNVSEVEAGTRRLLLREDGPCTGHPIEEHAHERLLGELKVEDNHHGALVVRVNDANLKPESTHSLLGRALVLTPRNAAKDSAGEALACAQIRSD